MTNTQHIELKKASMGYEKRVILKEVDISLEKGLLHCIFGKNGSGKTTFLKSICGLLTLIDGEINIEDLNLKNIDPRKRSKLISMVTTNRPLIANITVAEYIQFGRYPYSNWLGMRHSEDNSVIEQVIRRCGLSEYTERQLIELSDGEMQKVQIARALAQNTPILLLDEVASHLDLANKAEIFHLLKQIAAVDGKTILFTSHDIQFSLQLADSFVIVNDGCANQMMAAEFKEKKPFEEILKSSYYHYNAETFSLKFKEIN